MSISSLQPAHIQDPYSLFAAVPGTALMISEQELIFQPDTASERHVMTPEVYEAFASCALFATIAQHASRIFESQPKLGLSNIERVLESFKSRALLLSAGSLLEKLPASGPLSPMRTLAIFSAGHPAAFEACLNSLKDADSQRDFSVVLADCSENPEHRARKIELLAEFGRKTGKRVVLLEQKLERWLQERLQQQPSHSIGWQTLFGKQSSAKARCFNALRWLAAQERVLILDDQQRPRAYADADFDSRGQVLGSTEGRQAEFFPKTEMSYDAKIRLPSLWKLLETHLGYGLKTVFANVSVFGMSYLDLVRLRYGVVRRIALGTLGHADSRCSYWVFRSAPKTLQTFVDKSALEQALSGDALALSFRSWEYGVSTGIQACALEFSPASAFMLGQGEESERFQAILTHFLTAESQAPSLELRIPAYLERRGNPPGLPARSQANRESLTPSFAGFLADQIQDMSAFCYATRAEDRLRWLAAQLRNLAQASNSERLALLWRYLSAQRSNLLGHLQEQLVQAGNAPENWRQELILTIQAQAEFLLQAKTPALSDAPAALLPPAQADWLGDQLQNAAAACDLWAELSSQPSWVEIA